MVSGFTLPSTCSAGQPPKVTGLLVLLSSWVIADPLDVYFSAVAMDTRS